MSNILVTGATGFVGHSLINNLDGTGHQIRATYRDTIPRSIDKNDISIDWIQFDIGIENNEYKQILENVDTVVHLAARVHAFDTNNDALETYRKINTEGTRRLAEEAAKADVRRFIFISTIKVNREKTLQLPDGSYQRFSELDTPDPEDAYAISKYEAEKALIEICNASDMDYVILRPPLVYGPCVRANFLQLIRIIDKGLPLPLASVINQRSLLYVDNLSHVIRLCIDHPQAANQIFLISDIDISLPDLIRNIAVQLDKNLFLIPFPIPLLKIFAWLFGKKAIADKLIESLLIDNSKLKQKLGWIPESDFDTGLKITIDWFLQSKQA